MNPNAPAGPAPATPPASDAAAMSAIISQLPAAPAEPTRTLDFDAPPSSIMDQPAPPLMPQAPAGPPVAPPAPYIPPTPPVQPPAGPPAPQPVAPQPPAPIPAAPAPTLPVDAIPIGSPMVPAAPAVDPNQMPAWAVGLANDIAALKGQPPAGAPPAASDWETNKPADWNDLRQRMQAEIDAGVKAGLTQFQSEARAQQVEADRLRAEADSLIDSQLSQLQVQGYLTPIANPTDPADPGRAAQSELISFAIALGTDNLLAVAPTLYTHHQNGYYYDRSRNQLVRRGSTSAAAQAPIAGSSVVGATGQPAGPTMRDFATKDLHTLADEANRAIPLT